MIRLLIFQCVLAVGVHQSLKQADLEHPYGWANFRNVASLVSGVGILCIGSGLSIYHGISGLLHPNELDSMFWVSYCAHSELSIP